MKCNKKQPPIGKVWAVCDHFGMPVAAKVLKESLGVDRTQLRTLVREGRLTEYDVTDENGQRQKAYSRPGGGGEGKCHWI